jgi:TolA-binding protein
MRTLHLAIHGRTAAGRGAMERALATAAILTASIGLLPAAARAGQPERTPVEVMRALTDIGLQFESARFLVADDARRAALQEAESNLDAVLKGKVDDDLRAAAALLSGTIRYERRDPAGAEEAYRRAAKGFGNGDLADDAEFARIQSLEAAGKDADAARDWIKWEARFAKSPLLPEARLAQAWNALRRGKLPEAEKLLQSAVTVAPWFEKDTRVALARATCAALGGRPDEALGRLGTASGAREGYLRGRCYAAKGNWLKAAASYQEVAERYPQSPLHDPALFAKANAFLTSRAFRSAAEEFARCQPLIQDPALRNECELRTAAAVQLSGSADSAAVLLRGVVERHPGTSWAARAQFLVGEVLLSQKKYEAAIPEFNRVLTSYFEHEVAASAQYRVARCLDALGRRAEATSAYQAVVSGYALAPEAPAAAYLAGVGLLDLGKPLVAAPYFQIVLDRYAPRNETTGAVTIAPQQQEIVEAALCLLELSYHRAGNLGQLSGAPHLLLQKMPPSHSSWRAYALLIDADAQAALGHHPEAQATLERLAREFPEHEVGVAANQLLAWSYAQQGRDSLAIATEERTLARYAARGDAQRLASAYLHMAHVRFNQKRYREAAAGYEDFLKRFPSNPQRMVALYQAGLCYVRLDRAGDAVDRWEAIVRDSASAPIAERAWARAGDLYFQAERYAEARRCYTGLLEHFANTQAAGVASLRLAQCAYNAGDDAAALTAFANVIARFPETPFSREASRGTEMALYRLGQKPQGRETLAKLVDQYPNSAFAADAQFQIAQQLFEAKRWDAAAEAFRRVVSQFPGSSNADKAQLSLAECAARAGKPEEAQQAYEQFLSFFPASELRPNVQFQLANMRFEAQDYMQAAVLFTSLADDSLAADVRSASLFNLGQCQRMLGAAPEARATLERYAHEHPGDERAAQVAYQLGDLDEAAGNAQAAVEHYEAAAAARPGAALATELSYRIGRCREVLQDADGALRAYQTAAAASDRNDPFRLSALARCASLYEGRGERSRAAQAYRDIARNAPDKDLAAAAASRAAALGAAGDSEDTAAPVPKKPAKAKHSAKH